MTVPSYTNPLCALRIASPQVAGGGGGEWATGKALETLIGERVEIVAEASIAPPYFSFERRPPGSAAVLNAGAFSPDKCGEYIVAIVFPRLTESPKGLVLSPDPTKIARVFVVAFPSDQLEHNALQFHSAATFVRNLHGKTLPAEGTPSRPHYERRSMLRRACQDAAWRAKVIANLEAAPSVTPAAALLDAGNLHAFGS